MREKIHSLIAAALARDVPFEVTVPERAAFGHYSANVALRLAKEEKKNPMAVAEEISRAVKAADGGKLFEKVEVAPPGFINFSLAPVAIRRALAGILKAKESFGRSRQGKGKKVIVEYASLNIAKAMHVGYLRNIAIGDALANIHGALGYRVIRWNYLGDWGTQFGKLIAAYKLWGDKKTIQKNPIAELQKLYVKFHAEAKQDPSLEDRGREEFRKLEQGDKENRALWGWFKKESLKVFAKTLKKLGVKFDVEIGEAFFEGEMRGTVDGLLKKKIARRSEGAVIVPLDEFDLPPALLEKSDGSSLYLTRDLANLRYRTLKYKPEKILYVVGNEQSLHFEQVFKVAEKTGLAHGAGLAHVKFGLVLGEGGKRFSTREGDVVLLEDLIEEASRRARSIIEEKHPDLAAKEKEHAAGSVGIGALKYANLRENRTSTVVFDWTRMLDFKGDSAPYLQYTHARLRNIERKAGAAAKSAKPAPRALESLSREEELALIRALIEFPRAIELAAESCAPNGVALYLYELANRANRFYESVPVLKEENAAARGARLLLVRATATVLKNGLALLGIAAPEKI